MSQAEAPGVLIDPAAYFPQAKDQLEGLVDYDDWLMRQRAAGAPLILTDTPRWRTGRTPVSWAGRPAPVATIQLRSSTCRRRDLAAILADSAALLQTPAVAESTEVGLS